MSYIDLTWDELLELSDVELENAFDEWENQPESEKSKIVVYQYIVEYLFKVNEHEYETQMLRDKYGLYKIRFVLKDDKKEIKTLTNFGNAMDVFNGILSSTSRFIEEYEPMIFQFEDSEKKRISVYDRIIRRYLPDNMKKYTLTTKWIEDSKIYRFTR